MTSTGVFHYQIDSRDCITAVDSAWLDFAAQNRAPELTRQSVIGRSIWSFFAGKEVRHLYGLILSTVRERHRRVVVPFRCDSPATRRFMELTVDDLGEGNLSLTATIIRKEPRSSVALFDISTRSSEEVVMICSWCKKIPVSHDQWVEVEDAVQALDLFITYPLPQLSHGMCPQCASEVAETMTRPSVVAGAASESSAPPDE